jgi:hypothetical protein
MSDGSKVVSVTFRATTPQSQKQKSQVDNMLISRRDENNR